jgi:APAF-1 helical domain
VFKPAGPIPFQALNQLWGAAKGFDPENTESLIYDLESRALVEIDESFEVPCAMLHDLLHDFLEAELGPDGQRAGHRALVSSYRSLCRDGEWHNIEGDGYLYDHLVYHLNGGGEVDEIKRLVTNPGWMANRVRKAAYQYEGYLSDLDIAWRNAFERVEEEDGCLAECAVYSLIRRSIHSIAANYVLPS